MTTRNLDALFAPKAIALVGASDQEGSVGSVLARNLLGAGFDGPIMPVNPHAEEIHSVRSFRSVAELPSIPDLAVIATPPRVIPGLISELAKRGCRAAVVITAGFDPDLKNAMLTAGRPHLMRIVGPNCLGFLSPIRGINASFAHLAPLKGNLAFVTQSGAIATSIIDWAIGRKVGFSHLVSLGDMSDVDFGDLLDFLALDTETKAILLYAETITQARKFMSAGRIAARAKPVIVVKGGRSRSGAAAAASHTGALAGADAVYDAVFRRAGMLRVDTLRELFDAAETLASGLHVHGDRLTILTNGGGLGVLAADALELAGGALAGLSEEIRSRLDRVLPTAWSHGNPVDILGDAQGDRYAAVLDTLVGAKDSDALLVMNCPTGVAELDGRSPRNGSRQDSNSRPRNPGVLDGRSFYCRAARTALTRRDPELRNSARGSRRVPSPCRIRPKSARAFRDAARGPKGRREQDGRCKTHHRICTEGEARDADGTRSKGCAVGLWHPRCRNAHGHQCR